MPRFCSPLAPALAVLACLFGAFASQPAPRAASYPGITVEQIKFEQIPVDVVTVDLRMQDLELHWKRPDGKPFKTFHALEGWLKQQGRELLFAMNAGIYARDHTPLGLHVEHGEALEPLNRKRGGGNFFLRPNGVFFINGSGAHILETEAYAAEERRPRLAVQSGPLLVEEGMIHSRFVADSDSVHLRNGVGVRDAHTVVFAVTRWPLNLHTFARLFRDRLDCPSALYLDGALSGMIAPGLDRPVVGGPYVGMLAISAPAGDAPPHEEAPDAED